MMPLRADRAFDQLAAVYDETREPPPQELVDRVATEMSNWGIHALLEAGVGTGRWASPLRMRGVAVVGVDASRNMLGRARQKGLVDLARGTAYRLPFGDRSVDATFFVHVLHVLDHPAVALREACRVGRLGAVALVEPDVPGRRDPREDPADSPRQAVHAALRRMGYTVPDRAGGPRARDRRLVRELPPAELVIVDEREVTENLVDDLEMLKKRGSRWTLGVPVAAIDRAVEEVAAQYAGRTVTYRRRRALARWTTPPLEPVPRGSAPEGPGAT